MIVGVAVIFKVSPEGVAFMELPKPARHADLMRDILAWLKDDPDIIHVIGKPEHQGFIDHEGNYLNRKEAMTHVRECGQKLLPDQDGHLNRSEYLFSEDVW